MAEKPEPTQEPADTYHRHGEADPSGWDEQETVTGRPADVAPENSTLAERAKARTKAVKSVDAENKAVSGAPATKSRRGG